MNYFILSILFCLFLVDFNLALDRKKDCKCRLVSGKKIIGGKIANKLDYRWQVSIAIKTSRDQSLPDEKKLNFHNCGGVILNENWILTAGQCIPPIDGYYRIGLATKDLIEMYDNDNYVDVEASYLHPNFKTNAIYSDYDIGLIKTASKINFTDMVQPACINFEKTDLYNGPLRLTGWGSINKIVFSNDPEKSMRTKISRFLKETVNYDITDKSPLCQHNNSWEAICVGNEKTKSVACNGDSGGPLHSTDSSGKIKVIGLASFTDMEPSEDGKTTTLCTGKGTAYTRVSAFKDFVEEHIGQDYCE